MELLNKIKIDIAARVLAGLLLGLACGVELAVAQENSDVEARAAKAARLDQRLSEARKQLDDAARRLAEVHRELDAVAPRPKKAMLGILVDEEYKTGKAGTGVKLVGVTPGGGAQDQGMQAGDLVVALNSTRLDTGPQSPMRALSAEMRNVSPGDVVRAEYLREGQTFFADITTYAESVEMMTKMREQWAEDDAFSQGIVTSVIAFDEDLPNFVDCDENLGEYFGVDEGVLVLRAAENAGELRSGDILLSLNSQPVHKAQAVIEAFTGAQGTLGAQVRRKGRVEDIEIDGDVYSSLVRKKVRVIRTREGNVKIEVHKIEP